MSLPILTPSEFVALLNQTLEFAYPAVEVEGEVANFKLSKGRWVYFDIKDEFSSVRCFGTVYSLPGPVEDGMMIRVVASPRMHPRFGFSLNIQSLEFSGQGTIKKAADLLMQKLQKEGLFATERKRSLPYPPHKIALITSAESAAYRDFIKVLSARFGGIEIEHIDVAVQGETAVSQIVKAVDIFNRQSELADVLVVIRGGGSSDDLQAFSSEQVVRAVAASRIPSLVAIGHETDTSLAELAADLRASTPSNAAELLVPDRKSLLANLSEIEKRLNKSLESSTKDFIDLLNQKAGDLYENFRLAIEKQIEIVTKHQRTIEALSPKATLKRGFSIVRSDDKVVKSKKQLAPTSVVNLEFADGYVKAKVK